MILGVGGSLIALAVGVQAWTKCERGVLGVGCIAVLAFRGITGWLSRLCMQEQGCLEGEKPEKSDMSVRFDRESSHRTDYLSIEISLYQIDPH